MFNKIEVKSTLVDRRLNFACPLFLHPVKTSLSIALFFFLLPNPSFSQACQLSISGHVVDESTNEPLHAVNIYLEESEKGAITGDDGFFTLDALCEGHYHVVVSHIGCETQYLHLTIAQDTVLQLTMDHSSHLLDGVVVTGKTDPNSTQNTQVINEQNITDNANQNLSNILETLSGVSSLKNGSSIAKPVVHGLYGNRMTILNNGIAQSGQQWGNDHSPEIDPLVATRIKVIKSVSALEYPGSNLGGVVLVEPKKIAREPHLHGRATYFFESNGLGNGLNLQLQRYQPNFAWKINGTLKKSGDRRAANYYLNNTGSQEANIALQIEKSFSERLSTDFYFSSFNTDLGVMRGSHIGNLTDLETAFTRKVPFFTEEAFSYAIEAPKQRVHHQLLKAHTKYFLSEDAAFDFTFAAQLNARREFDVRRSGRTEIPALSLRQFTYFAEGKYQQKMQQDWQLKTGIQFNMTDNINVPETGILPLIPDYFAYETGAFLLANKKSEKWLLELGGRYDNVLQKVVTFSSDIPRTLLRYTNNFHNYSLSGGLSFQPLPNLSLAYNIGLATRNPAINELYSAGLHQGVSGIEEGSLGLMNERSLKTTFSINGKLAEHWSLESLFFWQRIEDYIFLNPENETRYTIRGAFPVFRYKQTDARLYGLDVMSHLEFSETLSAKLTYSYLRGDDISKQLPLINMPANNFSANLRYLIPKWKRLENLEFQWTNRYVFEQTHLLDEQDYLPPPEAYYLLGLQLASDWQLPSVRLRIFASIDNLLNTAYRDYLNRQRYFADDLGINGKFGLSVKF